MRKLVASHADDLGVLVGLGCMGWGIWELDLIWSRSAVAILVGAVVLWLALPPRAPFITKQRER